MIQMKKTIIAAALLLILPTFALSAQNTEPVDTSVIDQSAAAVETANPDSVMVLGRMVSRIAIQPVASGASPITNAIDTIDTPMKGVCIVLYNDNTWKYIVTSNYQADAKVFDRCWDTKEVNPYKSPIDSLPECWTLWMVDSLRSYHAPATGRVTSRFGMRRGRRHQGVDLSLQNGTPLYSVFDGKVRFAGQKSGYGYMIIIRHNNGMETFYGHMSQLDVKSGDYVHAGDVIGLSGNTGRSTGPHLHFETRYEGLAFDPQRIIDFNTGFLRQRMMVLKRRYFDASSRYDQNFDDEFLNMEDDKKALEEAARKAMVWHKVKNGENLGAIARKYHTSVNAICHLNGIKNPNTLRAGKTIRVR